MGCVDDSSSKSTPNTNKDTDNNHYTLQSTYIRELGFVGMYMHTCMHTYIDIL